MVCYFKRNNLLLFFWSFMNAKEVRICMPPWWPAVLFIDKYVLTLLKISPPKCVWLPQMQHPLPMVSHYIPGSLVHKALGWYRGFLGYVIFFLRPAAVKMENFSLFLFFNFNFFQLYLTFNIIIVSSVYLLRVGIMVYVFQYFS